MKIPVYLQTGALLGILGAVLFGCGRSGPEVVKVKGTVTYGGGAWPKPGMLYFTPVRAAEGLPKRSGWAEFDLQGNFAVTSFQPGDGLVPGLYRAAVECWKNPPSINNPSAGVSYVPKKYQSPMTSGLEVNVPSDQGPIILHWDVPKP